MILIKPLLTEKTISLAENGTFTFVVDPKASKTQIKSAIKSQFNVDPISVNTSRLKKRQVQSRKTGHYQKIKGSKKAYITLKPKQTIELFNLKQKK